MLVRRLSVVRKEHPVVVENKSITPQRDGRLACVDPREQIPRSLSHVRPAELTLYYLLNALPCYAVLHRQPKGAIGVYNERASNDRGRRRGTSGPIRARGSIRKCVTVNAHELVRTGKSSLFLPHERASRLGTRKAKGRSHDQ